MVLVIVVLFMGFGQAGAKKVWGVLKSHQLGGRGREGGGDASNKRDAFFIGKAGSHYVILLYCETLLQVLLVTVKDFIGYLFSL